MSNQPTYEELKKQIADLERKAEEVRKAELAEVIAAMRQKITEFGLTAADLGFSTTGKKSAKVARTPAGARLAAGKYRNPATGEIYEYGGRGRKPSWIAAMSAEDIAGCKL